MTSEQPMVPVSPPTKAKGTMKTAIALPIIAVLVVVVVVVGFLLFQNMSDLSAAEDKITEHEATIASLQSDLAASQAEVTDLKVKLTASQAEVSSLEGEVAGLETNLASTRTQLTQKTTDLTAAQTVNTTLTAELKKIKDPRHFSSVTELKDWLQKDDTNTKYASMEAVQRSFILQIRALRDGFLLPASFYYYNNVLYVINMSTIGNELYSVSSYNDTILLWDHVNAQPSHPEPLP